MKFSFENLQVYQDALTWVGIIHHYLEQNKRQLSRSIRDQLGRAALSIPLNIAEGNGRWHKGDKRQFYSVARGSVFECVAILQVLEKMQLLSADALKPHVEALTTLTKMLSGLIKSVEGLNQEVDSVRIRKSVV